jgi:hypothetical protein
MKLKQKTISKRRTFAYSKDSGVSPPKRRHTFSSLHGVITQSNVNKISAIRVFSGIKSFNDSRNNGNNIGRRTVVLIVRKVCTNSLKLRTNPNYE